MSAQINAPKYTYLKRGVYYFVMWLVVGIDALESATACSFNCQKGSLKGLESIRSAANSFNPDFGDIKEFYWNERLTKLKENQKYCSAGVWSEKFPRNGFTEDESLITEEIRVIGDNLYNHFSNAWPFGIWLYRNQLRALGANDPSILTKPLMAAVTGKAFTQMEPVRFRNAPKNYPQYAEQKAHAYMVLMAMALSYASVEEYLNDQQQESFKTWGIQFFESMKQYDDEVDTLEDIIKLSGPDRGSIKIMGLTIWASVMRDESLLREALGQYLAAIEAINASGWHKKFMKGHKLNEIRYTNDTYGALAITAFFLERAGFPAWNAKNSDGVSLKDGVTSLLNYLETGADPKIPEPQKSLEQMLYHSRSNVGTLAWTEYVNLIPNHGLEPRFLKLINKMRNTGPQPQSQSRDGLYSFVHGGYTTCFLANL